MFAGGGKDRQRGREGLDTGLPGVGCGQPLKPWPRRRAGQAIGGPLGRASRTARVITNRLTDRAVARGHGSGHARTPTPGATDALQAHHAAS